MIRQDGIRLTLNKSTESRIVARQFRGSENLYTIRLPSGGIVHSSESSTSVYQEGTPVRLRISATPAVLFTTDALPGGIRYDAQGRQSKPNFLIDRATE